jgi:hypothetical protein
MDVPATFIHCHENLVNNVRVEFTPSYQFLQVGHIAEHRHGFLELSFDIYTCGPFFDTMFYL